MFDYVNAYLSRAKEAGAVVVPYVRCGKDLEMSIQASSGHYCAPQDDDGPWTHVEVGFPSREPVSLRPYREGDPLGVYFHVPVDVLNRVIACAGGIVEPVVVLPPPSYKLRRRPRKNARRTGT